MSNAALDWVREHGGARCRSAADVATLLLLADAADPHGLTWVTHERLLESLPTSRRQTVSESCRRLQDDGVTDVLTVDRGARRFQIVRVGAGELGPVPESSKLPGWCSRDLLPTSWTSTPDRAGDSSTVERSDTPERAGQASTVERAGQNGHGDLSSTVERESPARLSVHNPSYTPQEIKPLAADAAVVSQVEVDGRKLAMPTRSKDDLTSRILEWAWDEGMLDDKPPRDPAGRADVALRTIGESVGDGPEATKSAQQICVELVQHVTGERAPGPLWGHLGRLVNLEDPREVARALTVALGNGAGLTAEHAIDPLALTKYAKAVLNGSRSAA